MKNPQELLNSVRLKALNERISKKAKEAGREIDLKTLEDAVDNLGLLLEEKEVNGEKQKFLPLQIKEELFHLLFPNGCIRVLVEFDKDLQMALATAKVFADNEVLLGEGLADQKVSAVHVFDSEDRALQATRRIAMGRAKSDALRNAGIASWFPDDMVLDAAIDHATDDVNNSLDVIDKTEEVKEKLKKGSKKIEDKPIFDENYRAPLDKTNPERPINKMLQEMDAEFTGTEPEEIPFEEVLKDPRAYTFANGDYKGKTIGDVEKTDPDFLLRIFSAHRSGKITANPDMIDSIIKVVQEDAVKKKIFDDVLKARDLKYEDIKV